MTRDEFVSRTVASLRELCEMTENYIDVSLEGKNICFRIAERENDLGDEHVTLDNFLQRVWSDFDIPWQIVLMITDVTATKVVVVALVSGCVSQSDPDWTARLEQAHHDLRPYLPYVIRIQRPPSGWLLHKKQDSGAKGPPDMDISLAKHGRYKMPTYHQRVLLEKGHVVPYEKIGVGIL